MKDFLGYTGGGEPSKEEWLAEAQRFADGYAGKNEGELVKEIYARALEGKKNGTLTNAQIDAFYAQLAPALDAARRKKLQKLVEQLKRT